MRDSSTGGEPEPVHQIHVNVTGSVQFALLLVVMVLSLLENLFLFLVSFSSVHRWFREYQLRRQLREVVHSSSHAGKNGSGRKNSALVDRVQFRLQSASDDVESNELCVNPSHHNSISPAPDEFCSVADDADCVENVDSHMVHGSSLDRIGNITQYYFGNLCFANLLLAILAMPFSIAASIGTTNKPPARMSTWPDAKPIREEHHESIMLEYPLIISDAMCAFIETVVSGILMATVLSLVQLTADRLMAICLPLHYVRLVTRRRALASIFLVWITVALFVSIPHLFVKLPQLNRASPISNNNSSGTDMYRCFILGQHDEGKHWRMATTYFVIVFLFPFIFIAVAYVKIYLTVRKCLKQVSVYGTTPHWDTGLTNTMARSHSSGYSLSGKQSNCPIDIASIDSRHRNNTFDHFPRLDWRKPADTLSVLKQRRNNKFQTKAAKTASMLVCTFFSLTAPYFVFSLIGPLLTVHSATFSQRDNHDELMETISSVIVWLLYVNSVLTPALYALRDGVVRRRIASIWLCPKKRKISNSVRSFIE